MSSRCPPSEGSLPPPSCNPVQPSADCFVPCDRHLNCILFSLNYYLLRSSSFASVFRCCSCSLFIRSFDAKFLSVSSSQLLPHCSLCVSRCSLCDCHYSLAENHQPHWCSRKRRKISDTSNAIASDTSNTATDSNTVVIVDDDTVSDSSQNTDVSD